MTQRSPTLRIACSGVVGAEYGSVASASFEVLQELLCRGHEVDFFSKRTYVYPERLAEHPGFAYHDSAQLRLDSTIESLPGTVALALGALVGNTVFMNRIVRAMRREHRTRKYDCELFLGLWAYGRIPALSVVSWVQGPPETDARSVIQHRSTLRKLCGWPEYLRLRTYVVYRGSRLGQPRFHHSDLTICGSLSSKETLVARYGRTSSKVRVLPYPVDLEAFCPAPVPTTSAFPEMLWIGRIVPRKRLDLFLDAGARLIREGSDVRLRVIGGYPYAAGYHKLIERFPFPERLTYTAHVNRDDVRSYLQAATVLVQPSEEENFGSAVAEALACGTPVVLGPSNGTGDYMGEGGVRFDDYSVPAVANAIGRVLRLSGDERAAMRIDARKAAVENFAVDGVVDKLEDILRSAGTGKS